MSRGRQVASMGIALLIVGNHCIASTPVAHALEDQIIVCAPERPAVVPREVIHIEAWTSVHASAYQWSVSGGHLEGQGADVTWDFTDVNPGNYRATVKASLSDNSSATCSMQVIVSESDSRGALRLSGRSLLNGEEVPGYGLYNYLLFTGAPNEAVRERYESAIKAYVSLMPDILALEKYLKPQELAITYVPVDAAPPRSVSADWILQHYDYARAEVILRTVPRSFRDGPYLLSTRTALSGAAGLHEAYLLQDLSTVPPNLVPAWIRLFLNQTAQERFWEPDTTALLGLRLRTAIGVMAVGLPDVQQSLRSWISWGH